MYTRFLRSTDAALDQQIEERKHALRVADDPRTRHELQQLLHIRLEREAEAWVSKHFEGERQSEIMILKARLTRYELAEQFGVHAETISRVIRIGRSSSPA